MLDIKDFNILGYKINTSSSKKDISVVTGYNSYVQKIENICKTQKGELPSDPYLGSDYYNLIFNPVSEKSFTEVNLNSYIKSAIPELINVDTFITYIDQEKLLLLVKFENSTYIKNQKMECNIEVPLQ